jgi:protein-tyrosine phosphatase
LALAFPGERSGPAFDELPPEVKAAVQGEDGPAFALPHHPMLQEALRHLPAPLVLGNTPADPAGPHADAIDVWIDDGPPRFHAPPTIARVADDGFAVVQPGAISASRLHRMAGEMILFVCTGNTCRSPLAEALFKRMLATGLHCGADELPERGLTVVSAGVAASAGAPASDGARAAARRLGADLDDHAAQPLAPQLALAADRLLVMTRDHLDIVGRLWPAVVNRLARVCPDGDIADPYGGPQHEYDAVAEQLSRCLAPLAREVLAQARAVP